MAVTATVIRKQILVGGLKKNTASLLLDNAYPVAGYTLTAAMFGLTRFEPTKPGTALVDPVVESVTPTVVLARVVAGKLLLSYPTGGGGTNPTTPAAPTILATAGAATASAVDATRPTGAVLPGIGVNLPNASDASAITVVASATGS